MLIYYLVTMSVSSFSVVYFTDFSVLCALCHIVHCQSHIITNICD